MTKPRARALIQSHDQIASYPGSRWAGEREPGIHCLRMRLISQKSWEIGNYRVKVKRGNLERKLDFGTCCSRKFCSKSETMFVWEAHLSTVKLVKVA